jgi:hypothetical protein
MQTAITEAISERRAARTAAPEATSGTSPAGGEEAPATSPEAEKPAEGAEAKATEPEAGGEPGVEAKPEAEPDPKAGEGEGEGEGNSRAQRRIRKLAKERDDAKAETTALKERLDALEAKVTAAAQSGDRDFLSDLLDGKTEAAPADGGEGEKDPALTAVEERLHQIDVAEAQKVLASDLAETVKGYDGLEPTKLQALKATLLEGVKQDTQGYYDDPGGFLSDLADGFADLVGFTRGTKTEDAEKTTTAPVNGKARPKAAASSGSRDKTDGDPFAKAMSVKDAIELRRKLRRASSS